MTSPEERRGIREEDALSAALACFARTGLQHTTMEDIARELRRSRPVVYRYFSDKNDAFRKVAQHLMDEALEAARKNAGIAETTIADRVFGVLDAKLSLAIRVHAASPHHARALLAEDAGIVSDLAADYIQALTDLAIAALSERFDRRRAQELAGILLALTRGLEDELRDPATARDQLRLAVELLCAPAPVAPLTTTDEKRGTRPDKEWTRS